MISQEEAGQQVTGIQKWLAGGAVTIIGAVFSVVAIYMLKSLAVGENLDVLPIPFVAIICGLAFFFLYIAYRIFFPRPGDPLFGYVFRLVFAMVLTALIITSFIVAPERIKAAPLIVLVPFIFMLVSSAMKMWRERA